MKLPVKLEGYMIYNTETGQFAGKGINNFKAKGGKVWSNLGHLKNHLQMYKTHRYKSFNPLTGSIVILYGDTLQKCVVYDVSTGEPLPDFDILEYIKDNIERTEQHYLTKGWEIVIQ